MRDGLQLNKRQYLTLATGKRFVGHIDQVPPRVSALKKDGVRLYTLARQKQVGYTTHHHNQ